MPRYRVSTLHIFFWSILRAESPTRTRTNVIDIPLQVIAEKWAVRGGGIVGWLIPKRPQLGRLPSPLYPIPFLFIAFLALTGTMSLIMQQKASVCYTLKLIFSLLFIKVV